MWDSAFLDVWDPAICSYLFEDVWWAGPCPTLPSVRPCHLKPIHLKMFWPSRNRRPLLSWFSFENHMWWICPQALYEPEPLKLQNPAGYHPSALTEKFEPQFSQTVKFSNCHVFYVPCHVVIFFSLSSIVFPNFQCFLIFLKVVFSPYLCLTPQTFQ